MSVGSSNFKDAILATKGAIDKDLACRRSRADASQGASAADVRQLTLLENRALMASCKVWTTADFEAVKVLGEGAFGVVHLVRKKGGGELFALKQIKKTGYDRMNKRQRLYAERDILAEATTRWFVQLYSTFQDDLNVYMVMEFLQGGDLIGHLLNQRRFTQQQTCFYMAEVLEALDTVHKCGFVHRDVKPDNIVLGRDGHIKLLDFGLAKQDAASVGEFAGSSDGRTTRAQLKSAVGTPQYMAPEVFKAKYGKEADLWALGIMTFECLSGRVPFNAGTRSGPAAIKMITDKVTNHRKSLPEQLQLVKSKGYVNDVSESFLSTLICGRDERATAEECRRDVFFQGIDFTNVHLQSPPIVPQLSSDTDTRYFEPFNPESRPLPAVKFSGSNRDGGLEWVHYEFDSGASLLSRSDLQGVLPTAPANSITKL